jgi:hypothetical protein
VATGVTKVAMATIKAWAEEEVGAVVGEAEAEGEGGGGREMVRPGRLADSG